MLADKFNLTETLQNISTTTVHVASEPYVRSFQYRVLRYHGRWIFKKNAKNHFFAVQIEKTEKNNLQKEWRKKLFYFLR